MSKQADEIAETIVAMNPMEQINKLLPSLTADQRAVLMQKLKAVSQFDPVVRVTKGGKIDHKSDDESFILASLERVCRAKGMDHAYPYYIRKLRGYKAFKDKVPGILRVAREADKSRIVQAAVLDLGWSLLHRFLTKEAQVVTTPQAMVNHAHMVVPCLQHAFPNYIENGLLRFVVSVE